MSHIERKTVSITGSTAGTTTYSGILNGYLLSVRYSSGGTISSTAPITFTNEGTDETICIKAMGSAGTTVRPYATICQSTGRTIYQTTGTTNPVMVPHEFAYERMKITIGKTTGTQTGTLLVAVQGA